MLHKLYQAFTKAVSLLCVVAAMVCPAPLFGQIIITSAGSGSYGYTGDGGTATSAGMDSVTSITFGAGNLYINDQQIHAVRKVNASGIISTLAGTGGPGYTGDGGPGTAAQLNGNFCIASDNAGNVYIADQRNSVIRKVNAAGIINTIAGTGVGGFSGDGDPAISAQLDHPIGITVDNSGNIYVGDIYNKRIRKISTSGIITTVAGNGYNGYSGDGGPATMAELSTYTYGLATDDAGNLYICDGYNHCIRKVSTTGIITTVAGNGTAGYGGDGGPATSANLRLPTGVYVSHAGEIYIADCKNSRIRKVNNAGIITTIAGTGVAGFGGDGVPAATAPLNFPLSVSADADENILIADSRNYRIRKIIKTLTFVNGHDQDLEICGNTTVNINTQLAVQDYSTGFTDTWSLLMAPLNGSVSATYSATSGGGILTPSGLTYTPTPGFTGMDSFKVKVANSTANDITTIHVKVNPLLTTAGTIYGPGDVCNGSAITLFASIPGGLWSSTSANVSIASSGSDCKVTGLAVGTSDVQYTLTNSCGSLAVSSTVTVNPLPVNGPITGADKVCLGSSITLAASTTGGIWNSSSGKATVTAGVVTGVAAGNDIIRYTVSNAWCQSTVTHVITVETFPDAKTISGLEQMCLGETTTLTDSAVGGVWMSGSPLASVFAITPVSPARCIVTALAAGAASISYSVTNSCGTARTTHPVAIYPLPDEPIISERLGLMSVPALYESYQWTQNGEYIPGANEDTFYVKAPSLYAVIVSNVYGCKTSSNPLSYAGCDPDDMLVYPNPTTATVRILWCQKVNARIMSIDGRVLRRYTNVTEVSLEGLPSAIYMVDIFNEEDKPIKTVRITRATGQ